MKLRYTLISIVSLISGPLFALEINEIRIDANLEIFTVLGNDFGEFGPNIVLYDTFENGDVGALVHKRKPEVGEWPFEANDSNEHGAYVTDDAYFSGKKSMVYRAANDGVKGGVTAGAAGEGVHGLVTFTEVFFSNVIRDKNAFPCGTKTSFGDRSCGKDKWLMLGHRGDNSSYYGHLGYGHDLVLRTIVGSSAKISGNGTKTSWWLSGGMADWWQFEQWNRETFYGKLNPRDIYGPNAGAFFEVVNDNGAKTSVYDGSIMDQQDGILGAWDRIKLGAWYKDAGVHRQADEVYMAIGRGAQARVILCDSATYSECTKMSFLIPSEWQNGKITARLYESPFSDNNKVYLHIFDENGNSTLEGVEVNMAKSAPLPPNDISIQLDE